MTDGGFIEALDAGSGGVTAPLKVHLPDELLLARLQFGDGSVQPLVILGLEDILQHIHVRGEKGIVQVVGIQGTVAAGLFVIDVVFLPIQIDRDGPPIIGDLDLHGFGCKLILDVHFCVLSAWGGQGGRTQKKPAQLMCTRYNPPETGMVRHGGYIKDTIRLLAVANSLCIPPP